VDHPPLDWPWAVEILHIGAPWSTEIRPR